MTAQNPSVVHEHVTCPFCGLACDDLRASVDDSQVELLNNDRSACQQGFEQASAALRDSSPTPRIHGEPASLEQAIARASELIAGAALPLISGLATDVAGARATLQLAETGGAVVDHMHSQATFRNLRVTQDSGWITASLADVRNRSDMIVVLGDQVFERFPRLAERIIAPEHTLFDTAERRVVVVGPGNEADVPSEIQAMRHTLIPLPLNQLGEWLGLVRALWADAPLQANGHGAFDRDTINTLVEQLKTARYSTVVWSAAELAYPHAELTVQTLAELIKDLNHSTRSVGLPLGGTDGETTFNQTCTWQSGYPVRTSFQRGLPEHEPHLYDHQRLLEQGEVDLLLWIDSLTPAPPPATEVPTIVIGHPSTAPARTPAVQIPSGIPGIDHAGHIFRMDHVAALPLRQLRATPLMAAHTILDRIHADLQQPAADAQSQAG